MEFHFKEASVLETWFNLLSTPIMKFEQRYAENHEFTLSSFGRELKKCTVCNVHFCGIFFQGYKCNYCDCEVHLNCLTNSNLKTCNVNRIPRRPSQPNPVIVIQTPSDIEAINSQE